MIPSLKAIIKKLALAVALIVFCLVYSAAPVQAAVDDCSEAKLRDLGVLIVNCAGDTPQFCGASATLSGGENAEKIWNFFISKGLTPAQAAGIIGNLVAESGLNPRRVQGTRTPQGDSDIMAIDGQTGYGLAQWTAKNRQQGLHDAAVAAGKPDSDLGVQLEYLWSEMAGLLPEIKALDDVAAVTSLFMIKFERPKDQSQAAQNKRAGFARDILARFGSATPANSANDVVVGECGNGEIIGGLSLPLDRRWYDEHPNWFSKPHHDYPAADIPVPTGTPVYAVAGGKIISVSSASSDCGFGMVIDSGNGINFIYCHSADAGTLPSAGLGDQVSAGQLIMNSNDTGHSTGPHLHLGIKVSGVNVCPQPLFQGIAAGNPPDIRSLPKVGCSY